MSTTNASATSGAKPSLSALQIWNMCFGFLGIQIGFDLQNGNVSRIFQTLGAEIDALPILWIAAPTHRAHRAADHRPFERQDMGTAGAAAALLPRRRIVGECGAGSSCPTRRRYGLRRARCGSWTRRLTSRWSRHAHSSATCSRSSARHRLCDAELLHRCWRRACWRTAMAADAIGGREHRRARPDPGDSTHCVLCRRRCAAAVRAVDNSKHQRIFASTV